MLTHTIRAFSLVGLILIAHTIKPFSLGNVVAFTRHTFRSFSFALPGETVERLEQAGELVALLGNGWDDTHNSPAGLANKLLAFKSGFSSIDIDSDKGASLKAKATSKQLMWAGKASRRFERTARSVQAHNQPSGGFGAAPLPIIPGLEASLIPGAALMTLPSFTTNPGDTTEDPQELFPSQLKLLSSDCEWRLGFEKQTWIPEEALLKLQEAQFPMPNVKVHIFNQRASKNQACSQPGKSTDARSGKNKQSC